MAVVRDLDLVIVSDVHLGTRSCQADLLDGYLASIRPRRLVLNGDIVDLREWGKGYWPASHTRVAERLLGFARGGCEVHYVCGNHDALLRLVADRRLADLRLVDRLELDVAGQRTLVLHGDRIEMSLGTNRLLRRAGCLAFRLLRFTDRVVNRALRPFTRRRLRLLRACKHLGRGHIEAYERACAAYAVDQGFDAVATGHIHVPRVAWHDLGGRRVLYLNSGDWTDHASALEHDGDGWRVKRLDAPAAATAIPPYAPDDIPAAAG